MDKLREQWDRVLGWCLIAAGGVALVLGWVGVARTPFPAEQLSFIASGGLGGVFLLGLGATLLLTADLRDEWIVLARIERELAGAPSTPSTDAAATTAAPSGSHEDQPADTDAAGPGDDDPDGDVPVGGARGDTEVTAALVGLGGRG